MQNKKVTVKLHLRERLLPSPRFPSNLAHIYTLISWPSMWNSLAQDSIVLGKCQSKGLTVKWTKIIMQKLPHV